MKTVIFGKGWIGGMLHRYFLSRGKDVFLSPLRINEFSEEMLNETLKTADVVINTIAKTNIDWCEKNAYGAFENNVIPAVTLAARCRDLKIPYVFFSSACIFESKDIEDLKYEDSYPNPGCIYSEFKVVAERLIRDIYPSTLIIRARLPISESHHIRNTIDKIISYDRLQTNQESVTVIEDMLPVLDGLITEKAQGVYHLINAGTISPSEIADIFGHKHIAVSKRDMDEEMFKAGRAKRVTTVVGSKRIPLLPDIRERIKEIKSKLS